jgi:2-polyprenyl-3-methyl-5-hydroxy-6-metoxy-1,4-benzoquinol methylase
MAALSPAVYVAADFSREAIAIGRRRAEELGVKTILWECHDIQNIDVDDSSFDVVVSCETIEHVERPRHAIRELARVLAPGGTLFLTTPNYLSALGAYRAYLGLRGRRYTEEGQPINRWMWTPWTAWLVALAGLRIREVDGVGHYAYLPGAPPRRITFLDRARRLTKWTAVHSLVVATKPISPR